MEIRTVKKVRKKRYPETSKILLIISDIFSGVTIIGTFAAVFTIRDASPLIYLIPGVFALSSVAHGFYFWKAKAENLHKYDLDQKITMSGSGTNDSDDSEG